MIKKQLKIRDINNKKIRLLVTQFEHIVEKEYTDSEYATSHNSRDKILKEKNKIVNKLVTFINRNIEQ